MWRSILVTTYVAIAGMDAAYNIEKITALRYRPAFNYSLKYNNQFYLQKCKNSLSN